MVLSFCVMIIVEEGGNGREGIEEILQIMKKRRRTIANGGKEEDLGCVKILEELV